MLLLVFALAQADTKIACFQQGPKLRLNIQQLSKQMSYSTEVWFLDHKLPSLVVKNIYKHYPS